MKSDNLVEQNMKLVYYIVSREYPTFLHDEDIIQSGMVGLCKAANTWDSTKAKFSTYAGRCIRNEINQEFIRRKPHSKNLSLDTKVGDDGTLAECLVGQEDIDYFEDGAFLNTLTAEERDILEMAEIGYSTDEIADLRGCSTQKIQKILRLTRLKARGFYED